MCPWLPSLSLTGEDEEAGAAGLTGGDCALGSVLHTAAGETHLPQLGQGNSPPGPHLSRIQSMNALWHHILSEPCLLFYVKHFIMFQGRVCGLCGNFDGNVNNDLVSSNNQLEVDSSHFGNSWKVAPSCADVTQVKSGLRFKSVASLKCQTSYFHSSLGFKQFVSIP